MTVLAPAQLAIGGVSLPEGDTTTSSFPFTVELSRATLLPVEVTYETRPGSATAPDDYAEQSGQLHFDPGDTSKTISVGVNGDILAEPDEEFHLRLLTATGAIIAQQDAIGTIVNDDTPPTASFTFTVSPGSRITFDASGSQPGSGGSPIVAYDWDFGDGSALSSSTATTSHTYSEPKTYTVGLTVTDDAGNRSAETTLQVNTCAPDVAPVNGLEYAALVRCVEAAFPQRAPRAILSTLRQIYYGAESWSNRVDRKWANIIPCGVTMPDPAASMSPKLRLALIQAKETVAEGEISHVFTTRI